MVKSQIFKQLHKKNPKLTISQIESIVNTIFESIFKSLQNNRAVELRNFGRFSVKTIKAKNNARNPKSGEIIYVPKKKKVSFKMSKHLKEEINK